MELVAACREIVGPGMTLILCPAMTARVMLSCLRQFKFELPPGDWFQTRFEFLELMKRMRISL